MKKLLSLFLAMAFLGAFSLQADQVDVDNATMIKNGFGIDIAEYSIAATAAKKQVVTTSNIAYQYTTDGWLQHVAIYADSVICTNVAGPREGVQFIIMNTGAIADMCHSFTERKNHVSHNYPWGVVRTYKTYQTVTFY